MTRLRPSGTGRRARARLPGAKTRIRLGPAGFDARPERPSSLRAQAQRSFRARAKVDEVLGEKSTPDASPPPPHRGSAMGTPAGGGERAVHGATPTALTRQVRALYEGSAVPVAEIARLAGVSQRTLYRYVEKGGWRRRYLHDTAAAVAKRASKRKPRACVTAKGAGGRYIRTEDAGKPFAQGLKALDPDGEARALAVCERAAALSEQAVAGTRRLRESISDARIMARMVSVVRDLSAIEAADRATAMKARQDDAEAARRLHELRLALARKINAAVAGWKAEDARKKAHE